ncbi:MAG TPA: MASE1 domain-containing protein [Burkholderiales bacterium]|nr:MASE1 domain-containing protein [Burkholderiales bacterium]
MQQVSAPIRQVSYWLWVLLLASVYFSAAKASLLLAIPPGYATAVWPPSGIALAAILMLGVRYWPGIWIGAAVANLTIETSFAAAAVIAAGNTLEALAGAALTRRAIGPSYPLGRGEDVVKFVAVAALSPTLAATIALIPLSLGHTLTGPQLLSNWWTWWQGDAAGIIIVTPLILAWTTRSPILWSRGKVLEAACFVLLLLGATWVTFGGTSDQAPYPLTFLITPFIIWAGLSFGQREVTAVSAVVCGLAVWHTVERRGPFAPFSLNESLLLLLAFASTVVVTGLVLSALLAERRKSAEIRLSESEERFRLMVLNVTDYAIFMLDREGLITSWNAGAERIKGYRANEIIGHHFSRFYPDEDSRKGKPHEALDRAAIDGRIQDEGWRVRKDGTMFWATVVITAMRDAHGNLLGFSKVVRDLTERKRAESELMGATALAEKANRAKSEFLARMSHELRTPLNSLLILAKLLTDNAGGNLTPKQVQQAQVIHEAGGDLLALINDLLDLARIESGVPTALNIGPAGLSGMKDYLESAFGQAARDAGLRFDIVVEEGLPDAVETDPQRLRQILRNLLANAFKFTRQGGVALRIAASKSGWTPGHAQLDRAHGAVAFSVSDTGVGIPEDKQELIFQAFQQVDGGTNREFGGTGLGLSISKELAQRLGGEIRVSSTSGSGSTFTLYLPLVFNVILDN